MESENSNNKESKNVNTPQPDQKKPAKKKCSSYRLYVRWICGMVVIPILGILAWANFFGIPSVLHKHVENFIHQEGLEFNFEKLYFHVVEGFYLKEGSLKTSSNNGHIELKFHSAQIGLMIQDKRLRPRHLKVSNGALSVFSETTKSKWVLCDQLESQIEFQHDNHTIIKYFNGLLENGSIRLSGDLKNAWSALEKLPKSKTDETFIDKVGKIIDQSISLQRMIKGSSPVLRVYLSGDAESPESLHCELSLILNHVYLDKIKAQGIEFKVTTNPYEAPSKRSYQAHLTGELFDIDAQQKILIEDGKLTLNIEGNLWTNSECRTEFSFSATDTKVDHNVQWRVLSPSISGVITNKDILEVSTTDFVELSGKFNSLTSSNNKVTVGPSHFDYINRENSVSDILLFIKEFNIEDFQSDNIDLRSTFNQEKLLTTIRDWGLGNSYTDRTYNLLNSLSRFDILSENLIYQNSAIKSLSVRSHWKPESELTYNLSVNITPIENEQIEAGIDLDFHENILKAEGTSLADIKRYRHFFSENFQDTLTRIHWDDAPLATFELGPAPFPTKYSNEEIYNWFSQEPRFRGDLTLQSGNFKAVPFDSLTGKYEFNDDYWYLSNVTIKRPEGSIDIEFEQNDITEEYTVEIEGPIYVRALRPLFEDNSDYYFDRISETGPVSAKITVGGPWDMDKGWVSGTLSHDSILWKNKALNKLEVTSLDYDDKKRYIKLKGAYALSNNSDIRISELEYDRNTDFLILKEVKALTTLNDISETIFDAPMEDIQTLGFSTPGIWTGGGTILIKEEDSEIDLEFQLEHPELDIKSIHFKDFESSISWKNDIIHLQSITTQLYEGKVEGDIKLNIADTSELGLELEVTSNDMDLSELSKSLGKDIEIEGGLRSYVKIEKGILQKPETWNGKAELTISDGNLWDIPLFGVLSKTLDTIIKGIGHSKITEGELKCTLMDGSISLNSCQFIGSRFGFSTSGSATTNGNLNLTGKLKIFQSPNPLNKLLNFTLSPITESFKFSIDGTIDNPVVSPTYILPRVLINPLKPTKWFKR